MSEKSKTDQTLDERTTFTSELKAGQISKADPDTPDQGEWVDSVVDTVTEPGSYVLYKDQEGESVVFPVTQEWTRIGRSLSAEIRFEDPTVSRRHALILKQEGIFSILDERSLNGISVNGDRVERKELSNRDQISIGRHTLHFVVVTKS